MTTSGVLPCRNNKPHRVLLAYLPSPFWRVAGWCDKSVELVVKALRQHVRKEVVEV